MSYAFELYYAGPEDEAHNQRLLTSVQPFGGRLTFREPAESQTHSDATCLTFEFANHHDADAAAKALRELGQHIEGPFEYGD